MHRLGYAFHLDFVVIAEADVEDVELRVIDQALAKELFFEASLQGDLQSRSAGSHRREKPEIESEILNEHLNQTPPRGPRRGFV